MKQQCPVCGYVGEGWFWVRCYRPDCSDGRGLLKIPEEKKEK